MTNLNQTDQFAFQISNDILSLPVRNTASVRAVRQNFTRQLKDYEPSFILQTAYTLIHQHQLRWVAYELIRYHTPTFNRLDAAELEALGQGIHSWDSVDTFARILSGPAWLHGLISDEVIHRWAHSGDLWWRRVALVSTVALNLRSQGGLGDVPRTLSVCTMLANDREDMVIKALSWALRALVVHDPAAVRAFLAVHRHDLAARVVREVNHKLETGLKNPLRKGITKQ
jgi:3-methyladenine DNA glycosylase AlkD